MVITCRPIAYRGLLTRLPGHGGYPIQYPGSAMRTMRLIGRAADYLFYDTDPDSVASLNNGARQVGLIGRRGPSTAADGQPSGTRRLSCRTCGVGPFT